MKTETTTTFKNEYGEPMVLRAVPTSYGWEIRVKGKPYDQGEIIASHIIHGDDVGETIANRLVECFNTREQLEADKSEILATISTIIQIWDKHVPHLSAHPNSPYAKMKELIEKHTPPQEPNEQQ